MILIFDYRDIYICISSFHRSLKLSGDVYDRITKYIGIVKTPVLSNIEVMSESSEEYCGISKKTSIEYCYCEGQEGISQRPRKPPLNGILKRSGRDNYKTEINSNDSITAPITITQDVIDKMYETELEDVLQYARDIVKPHHAVPSIFSYQTSEVVKGSFRHLLSVKEIFSKSGHFKYRTIEIGRTADDDLGFSLRQGDDWERKDGIYISRISLGSIIDQYEILTVGDELMQINKVDVTNMKVKDVITLMHIPEKLSITIKMLNRIQISRIYKQEKQKTEKRSRRSIVTWSDQSNMTKWTNMNF